MVLALLMSWGRYLSRRFHGAWNEEAVWRPHAQCQALENTGTAKLSDTCHITMARKLQGTLHIVRTIEGLLYMKINPTTLYKRKTYSM